MKKEFVPLRNYSDVNFKKGFKPADSLDYKALLLNRAGMIYGLNNNNLSGRRHGIKFDDIAHPNADLIREKMTELGLSQRAMADSVGVSKTTINLILNKKGNTGRDILVKMAEVFNVEVGDLIRKSPQE